MRAGYNVLNQQVDEGKQAARTFGTAQSGLGGKNVSAILNRLVRTYSDIGAVWVDLLIAATERDAQPAPAAAPAPAAHAAAPPPGAAVAVELTASRPVTARARLYRGTSGHLTALPLRGVGPDAPEIPSVAIVPGPLVQLTVPADLPAGQYHGIVIEDGADEPAGSISVRVHEVSGD